MEAARDRATATALKVTEKREEQWNKKAVSREFSVGDSMWIRRPGLDTKLRESWIGPCKVVKKNSSVSYSIQTEDRLIPTVHIQQMKHDCTMTKVKWVTSILKEDTENDIITDRFAEAKVKEKDLSGEQQQQLQTVLSKYDKVLNKEPGLTSLVQFSIDTGQAEPIYQRPYGIPVAMREKVDSELDWLIEREFIRTSSSPWVSPMVTVKKPDGSARLCVDFRKINQLTRQIPFYMPRVEEVLEGVGQAHYISKLDLSKGYYQVRLDSQSMEKTAFTSHWGVFEFTRMPFSVKNAPACFQELMNKVLTEQRQWATAYMDDVVVYSRTWEDHIAHLDSVLKALEQAGLTANPVKCKWGGTAVEFLGHWIKEGSMSIPKHKVEVLMRYKRPQTKKELRAFIGSVSFYRRYLPQLAEHNSSLDSDDL